ncbi:hypothetical protein SAMN05216207_102439 [Pseudonocardia ammonioxydans]|uniref:Uncharacterized protein n=2 Tax=Pseudonocardia ammonioxydans TaxID=260086 RepID=A0A1I5CVS3_PSUAM|nr:hypothetical protein SAMN05216207_102439 [Pseudonocardia ammonioxydans]
MVMRAAWRSVRALVVGVGLLVLVLLAAVLIDRWARVGGVVWAVVALLTLPLTGAGMILHDHWAMARRAGGRAIERRRPDAHISA